MSKDIPEKRGLSLGPFVAGRTDLQTDHSRGIYRCNGLSDWTLHYTYRGIGRIDGSNGQQYLSKTGDLLLYKPGIENDYGIDERHRQWTHLWATFAMRESWLRLSDWPEILPGIFCIRIADTHVQKHIIDIMQSIIEIYHSPYSKRDDICLSMLHTIFAWAENSSENHQFNRLDTRIQDSIHYMHEHLAQRITLDDLACISQLSSSRYSHLFRQQTGNTPMQFLERQRIQRACNDLRMSARPIAEIAESVGIEDPAYFTRIFRRLVHTTPRAYRQGNG